MKKHSIRLIFYSSNKILLLKVYLNIITKILNLHISNTILFKVTSLCKLLINKISLLKSPHVNKKAWAQYKQTIYIKQLIIYSDNINSKLIYFFFKHLLNKIPTHIQFKIINF